MSALGQLRQEFDQVVIGELIYKRVERVMRRLLKKRDPRIYARGAHDFETELGAIVNDFIMAVLLAEARPQINYIIDNAGTLQHFDALVERHARKFLAANRVRDVPSNMVDRALKRMRKPPFVVVHEAGVRSRFGIEGKVYGDTPRHTSREVNAAASLAALVPRLQITAEERLPRMYDEHGLVAVLTILLETVTEPVSIEVLQEFFDGLLTAWQSSLLVEVDDRTTPARDVSPDSEPLINESVASIFPTLTADDRLLVWAYLAGAPDADTGRQLGIERTAVIARRQKLFMRLRSQLDGLNGSQAEAVVRRLGERISLDVGSDN